MSGYNRNSVVCRRCKVYRPLTCPCCHETGQRCQGPRYFARHIHFEPASECGNPTCISMALGSALLDNLADWLPPEDDTGEVQSSENRDIQSTPPVDQRSEHHEGGPSGSLLTSAEPAQRRGVSNEATSGSALPHQNVHEQGSKNQDLGKSSQSLNKKKSQEVVPKDGDGNTKDDLYTRKPEGKPQ